MSTTIKWITIVLVGGAFGIWFGMSGIEMYSLRGVLILASFIFILSITIVSAHHFYVLYVTKNIGEVETYLTKAKSPYYVFTRNMINHNFEEAAGILSKIKNPQLRSIAETHYYIETNRLTEVKQVLPQIKNQEARHIYNAMIALIENDWTAFEKMKGKIKHKGAKCALEADAAFKKGDHKQAESLGDLAISNSSGLQRYIFIKALEQQKDNLNRKSYF
jgi:hypothetical protein